MSIPVYSCNYRGDQVSLYNINALLEKAKVSYQECSRTTRCRRILKRAHSNWELAKKLIEESRVIELNINELTDLSPNLIRTGNHRNTPQDYLRAAARIDTMLTQELNGKVYYVAEIKYRRQGSRYTYFEYDNQEHAQLRINHIWNYTNPVINSRGDYLNPRNFREFVVPIQLIDKLNSDVFEISMRRIYSLARDCAFNYWAICNTATNRLEVLETSRNDNSLLNKLADTMAGFTNYELLMFVEAYIHSCIANKVKIITRTNIPLSGLPETIPVNDHRLKTFCERCLTDLGLVRNIDDSFDQIYQTHLNNEEQEPTTSLTRFTIECLKSFLFDKSRFLQDEVHDLKIWIQSFPISTDDDRIESYTIKLNQILNRIEISLGIGIGRLQNLEVARKMSKIIEKSGCWFRLWNVVYNPRSSLVPRIVFVSQLGRRVISESKWALSLCIKNESVHSELSPLLPGGHAVIVVEGLNTGEHGSELARYFRYVIDFCQSSDNDDPSQVSQGEIRIRDYSSHNECCSDCDGYTTETLSLEETPSFATWIRTPRQINLLIEAARAQQENPPRFHLLAHTLTPLCDEAKNCILWAIQICKSAQVFLPDMDRTLTPYGYMQKLNTQYKEISRGRGDAREIVFERATQLQPRRTHHLLQIAKNLGEHKDCRERRIRRRVERLRTAYKKVEDMKNNFTPRLSYRVASAFSDFSVALLRRINSTIQFSSHVVKNRNARRAATEVLKKTQLIGKRPIRYLARSGSNRVATSFFPIASAGCALYDASNGCYRFYKRDFVGGSLKMISAASHLNLATTLTIGIAADGGLAFYDALKKPTPNESSDNMQIEYSESSNQDQQEVVNNI